MQARPQPKISYFEEERRNGKFHSKLVQLRQIIGEERFSVFEEKAINTINRFESFVNLYTAITGAFMAVHQHGTKGNLERIRDQIELIIKECVAYLRNPGSKKDMQAYMKQVHTYITQIDKLYAEWQQLQRYYQSLDIEKLAASFASLQVSIINNLHCPAEFQHISFCVDFYKELKKEIESTCTSASVNIPKIHANKSILSFPAAAKTVGKEINTLVHAFMIQKPVANFITGAKMQLAYQQDAHLFTQPAAVSSTAAITTVVSAAKPIAAALPKEEKEVSVVADSSSSSSSSSSAEIKPSEDKPNKPKSSPAAIKPTYSLNPSATANKENAVVEHTYSNQLGL